MQKCYPNKKGKQIKAALNLELFGIRIINLQREIENGYIVLNDPNSTLCDHNPSLSTIKITIFLFLDLTAEFCIESSKIFSSMPSLECVHRYKVNEMKQNTKKIVNNEKIR